MSKWRELNEDEKPQRGMEIRIPGDKTPLGVVIKVGPGEIKYRPHGGGALQTISANAEVEVRATDAEQETATEKPAKSKKSATETETAPETKPKRSKAVKPKPEPEQLEIVEEYEEPEEKAGEAEEVEEIETEDETEETDEGETEETEQETETDAPTPTTAKGWFHIEQLVEQSGVPLGRILKARREGAFDGMTKSDPDYTGVGRKPLIYSPAALKVASSLSGGKGKGGRPRKSAETSTSKETSSKSAKTSAELPRGEKSVRAATRTAAATIPPKRFINVERPGRSHAISSKPSTSTAPAQSHLYAAGESLQTTLDGINAEIERLNDLKARLEEAWTFFEV